MACCCCCCCCCCSGGFNLREQHTPAAPLPTPHPSPPSSAAPSQSACALSACACATTRVLSKWSGQAGPRPMHCSTRPPHVLCTASQGRPVSVQKAPCVLGDVSPTLAWQKAETKPGSKPPPPRAQRSMNCAAAPLLSPLTRVFVLFMLVPCTGNQEKAPTPLRRRAGKGPQATTHSAHKTPHVGLDWNTERERGTHAAVLAVGTSPRRGRLTSRRLRPRA